MEFRKNNAFSRLYVKLVQVCHPRMTSAGGLGGQNIDSAKEDADYHNED